MILPDIDRGFLPVEEHDWSLEAQRLADFLRRVSRNLHGHAAIKVYGSAAVTFFTAARLELSHMTEDIDIGHPGFLEPDLERARQSARQETVDVDFHLRPPGMWLAAADWVSSCFDISDALGTHPLSVELMHPIDLIISKMIRWNERDAEDAMRLWNVFALDAEIFALRLNQAVQDSMVTSWQKTQLLEILEELFPDEGELQRARNAAPALTDDLV